MSQSKAKILLAKNVITVNPNQKMAKAVGIVDDKIVVVGDLEECQKELPHGEVEDLGDQVILPGFIEPHSHPIITGISITPPCVHIAPWVAETWDDILKIFHAHHASTPKDHSLLFIGFDRLSHKVPAPTAEILDEIFGDRLVAVADNSGHGLYVNSAVLNNLGFLDNPPEDPPGGRFVRKADGKLNGQGLEERAINILMEPVLKRIHGNPLVQAAQFLKNLSLAGYTYAADLMYMRIYQRGYEILCGSDHSPVRIGVYHSSADPANKDPESKNLKSVNHMLDFRGVKFYGDGSPWVGNIALSFPYKDSQTNRDAGIEPGERGERFLNFTKEEMIQKVDSFSPFYKDQDPKEAYQMATHTNGDLTVRMATQVYQTCLTNHNMLNKDHRWRIEHVGASQKDDLKRAGELGVVASMFPGHIYYWGDFLDGCMFESQHGRSWQRFRSAWDSGLKVSFHNDGPVSPPSPLLNIQIAVTRKTKTGHQMDPDEALTLDEAIQAQTLNGAYSVFKDDLLGSIEPGKLADFTILSKDPYEVNPEEIGKIEVKGTWVNGKPVDIQKFMDGIEAFSRQESLEKLKKETMKRCC